MQVASLEKIILALDEARVRYLIAGGVAVIGYGFLRFTKDVDFVVQLDFPNLLRALKALEQIGYRLTIPVSAEQAADPSQLVRWRTEKNMIVMQMWSDTHRRTPIDIFITEPFAFDPAYDRAPVVEVEAGVGARLVPIDLLIQMKVEAGRPSDLIDVENLRTLQDIQDE